MSIIFLFVLFFGFMIIRIPIAWSLVLSSLVYLLANGQPVVIIAQKMTASLESFVFIALPLFILAGEIMNTGGLTEKLVNVCRAVVGRFKGGLAYVNVVASALAGTVQGMATANVVSEGPIIIPAMSKQGYSVKFAAAVTLASSTISAIIPPSVIMIIFGSVTGVSVGGLFIGGIIPGIILTVFQMIYIFLLGHSPRGKEDIPNGEKLPFKTCVRFIWQGVPALVLPLLIVVGVGFGIVTITESAVLAVVYSLFLAIVTREMKIQKVPQLFWNCCRSIGTVMIILCASSVFGYILTQERVPQAVVAALLKITSNKYILRLIINLFLLFVGLFMDPTPAVLILAPILTPVLMNFGMHPIHIGIMICFNLIQGQITPPVGGCLFLVASISKISVEEVSKATLPFYVVNIAALLTITFIPDLVLVLPRLLGFV